MRIELGTEQDINSWMNLVEKVKDAFPGLETREAMHEHKNTVLDFMGRDSAICAKKQEKMVSYMITKMDSQRDISVTTYRDGVPAGIAARELLIAEKIIS